MTSERRSKRTEDKVPPGPSEFQSTTLEWPLHNLKQLFDNSKGDHKSKVVKSPVFGGGRWTVLFYAQSGSEQYCSLYLNAEPLEHERISPLHAVGAGTSSGGGSSSTAGPSGSGSGSGRYQGSGSGSGRKTGDGAEEQLWKRDGLFRFTFTISIIGNKDAEPLGRKEASDHVFSHKTSNWGWASFARRADVFYNQSSVKQADAFLITVTISTVYESPRIYKPVGQSVPNPLVYAWGSLLDDPEHSDVVFLFPARRSLNGRRVGPTRKLYAIKKILSARSTYFRDMFEGNFLESEQAEVNSDAGSEAHQEDQKGRSGKGSGPFSVMDDDEYRVFDMLMDNSDEELDDILETPSMLGTSTPPLGSNDDLIAMSMAASGVGADDSDPTTSQGQLGDERDREMDEDGDELFHDDEDDAAQGGGAAQNTSSVGHETAVSQFGLVPAASSASPGGAMQVESPSPGFSMVSPNVENSTSAGQISEDVEFTDYASPQDSGLNGDTSGAISPTRKNVSMSGASPTKTAYAGQNKLITPVAKARSRRQMNARTVNSASASANSRKRRQVVIQDSAYPTFRALLHFLYTDTVNFAPLTSSFLPADMSIDELGGFPSTDRDSSTADKFALEMHKAHKKRQEVIDSFCSQNPQKPMPCSSKAMYKLADKLHIEDLRKRAQDHIASSLTVHCIVYEVFGNFTMRFADIRKMEIEFLLKHWDQVKRSSAMKTIFSRAAAHPGLAEVWPYLLSQLEYKRDESSSEDEETE
ncbi:hypothetical protein OC846_003095 [Tilletia horrida]|uniref:BTB domain-containing protein n=1 Tax=Tilletia horrida TaxID=155126 RepID=A0AAN6GQA5_9BASI|nr:hypothetical protein OC845_002009 [Tilletia horrida]KAK0551914.1 hypothetical protein OC846_003095 [Tilletia horrida]KAK0568666.1 hypothetical protein OC861_001743 [Tilletia horrida]